jgi:hypothetical protein
LEAWKWDGETINAYGILDGKCTPEEGDGRISLKRISGTYVTRMVIGWK